MPKPAGLPSLNLTTTKKEDGHPFNPLSSRSLTSPQSPRSMPSSPVPQSPDLQSIAHPAGTNGAVNTNNSGNGSPRITAVPDFPSSPEADIARHGREPSKSFFSNLIASKSSHRLQTSEPTNTENEKVNGRSREISRERTNYELRTKDSKPDLPRMMVNNEKASGEFQDDANNLLIPPGSSDGNAVSQKKSRSKLGGILNRNRATKIEDDSKKKGQSPGQLSLDLPGQHARHESFLPPLRTAPFKPDYRERTFIDSNGSTARTRSADRGREDTSNLRKPGTSSSTVSASAKESSMLAGIQSTGKGVSDRWGRAGKGLFSKITRSGSSTERDVPSAEDYICTTINLPLVQQTRKTRIAKRLELSRDKTEFWMPALPWRCIDYLNMNGCEEEGLYRIPGSGREVKLWQKRFDTEFDINLLETQDLYDINTIGSLFKSWLRELPDEILPKTTQAKIQRECAGATTTPQLLKDELSKLPPFNYYLLFAITCHLSLLHSFADKNKMDYRNLCICFQPCLKIDAFCFQFLVINWKECWQGCWTEHEHLQEEYRWENDVSKPNGKPASVDERAISSSGSSQPAHGFTQQARSAESGLQRKNSAPSVYHKQRNGSIVPTHVNSSSVPTVPRVVTTPEPKRVPDSELPQLGNLSPIRM